MLEWGVVWRWGGLIYMQSSRKTTGPPVIVLQQVGGRWCVAAGPQAILTPKCSLPLLFLFFVGRQTAGGSLNNSLDFSILFWVDCRNKVLDWREKILQLSRWIFSFCAENERVNNVWFHIDASWVIITFKTKGKLNIATISRFDEDSHTTLEQCLYLTLIND